jgi:hypothetical protein
VSNIKRVEVRDLQEYTVLANVFGAGQPGGGTGQRVEKEARLVSTGILANAKGRARVEVESEREELRVEGEDLLQGASYEIIADGVTLGVFIAQSGYLRAEFASDGSSGLGLPAQLRPVTKIQQVEIRNSSGQAVLRGSFQAGGNFGGDDDGGTGGGSGGGSGSGSGDGGGSGSGGGSGGGPGSSDVQREAQLNPTGIDADARGEVKIKSSSSREELEIKAEDLNPNAQYTIVVDGFTVAVMQADGSGKLELRLSSEAGNLPAQVRPLTNINRVDIINSSGQVVLSGGPPA